MSSRTVEKLHRTDNVQKGKRTIGTHLYRGIVTDRVTGLYEYEIFLDKLTKDMHNKKLRFAIIYTDIKNFRYINEHFGHDIGDKVLRIFSKLIKKYIKGYVYSSRIHSDNIVVVCAFDKSKSEQESIYRLQTSIEKISSIMQSKIRNKKIYICAGAYIIEDGMTDAEEAVSNANFARKEARKLKSSKMVIFEDKFKNDYNRKMELASELPRALENREIKVYYQPKIESETGIVAGGEALVRWQKPDGTFIYPNDFIPYFEESGLIVDVDFYVYNEVFASIRKRIDDGLPIVPVSMNISRAHLESDKLITYIRELFDKYNLPAEYVEFELTESVYMQNYDNAMKLIEELRKMGVKISMDDFGSGYSSLNMLNSIPIDILKIDKVFLGNEKEKLEPSQKIIIQSVVDMANKLNMRTVCEGVESEEQNEFLTSIGCDMIQGFFYEKPVPEDSFYEYLKENGKK